MNKRQAKKYKIKNVVDRMVNATTNSTVEEHKNGKLSNTKRIKHYTTVVRQTFPKPEVKIAKKRVRPVPQWRERLGTAPQDTEGFGVEVVVRSKRTRAEYFKADRLRFIGQFMKRLKEQFPDAPQNKVNAIKHWLYTHDSETIDDVLQDLDDIFREMYYESASRYMYNGQDMDVFIDEFLEVAGIDGYDNNEVLD